MRPPPRLLRIARFAVGESGDSTTAARLPSSARRWPERSEGMGPKDRVETLVKTEVSLMHKRMSGGDAPAGAR